MRMLKVRRRDSARLAKMKRRLASSREEHSSARKRSKPSTSRGEEDEDTEEEIPVPRVARKRSADSNPHARKMSKPSTSRVEEDEESSEEMLDTLETSQLGTQDEQKAIIQSEKLNPNVSRKTLYQIPPTELFASYLLFVAE